MVRIYDSAERNKVEFEPVVAGRVSMYVCGPTPYDAPHVGHGRTALVFDVIRRYFAWTGLEVVYVSNITDVEDKIIARAAESGTSESELVAHNVEIHEREFERLNIGVPDHQPYATEFIEQMQALIAELVAGGRAYVIEGRGVYFSVPSYDGYGGLSGRSTDDLLEGAGARVDVDERKRSPLDFALWKEAKPGEPSWPSPWGDGRPGWHIECSAMSLAILGERFDLHGGGDDLLFPHHENERAQAEGAGHEFARHWLHSGMVMAGGEKMSKSLGNVSSLADASDRHGPRAFRLLALQTHYRRQMEITDAYLKSAGKGVRRLDDFLRRVRIAGVEPAGTDDLDSSAFRAAMDDDFDTPAALAVIFEQVSDGNVALDEGDLEAARCHAAAVQDWAGALGLEIDDGSGAQATGDGAISDDEIERRLRERDAARAAGDFATADQIRDDLAEAGVALEDGAAGTTWHR